ncbi:MAG: PEP-CTERM sorting domain-containing protein [Burkholderiales bacterium]|jgi:hypothetical protein|nr:PEP-CTERM sorting domain-containing protein [Burkholderiales bacterium]
MFKQLVLAAALAGVGASAHAITITKGGNAAPGIGQISAIAGATFLRDFDGVDPGAGLYTGGAVVSGNIGGVTAAPPGDTSSYFHVGPGGGSVSSSTTATIDLAAWSQPVTYFGFYLGSPDSYNGFTVEQSNGDTLTFDGTFLDGLPVANGNNGGGNQSIGYYVNIAAAAGTSLTKVVFSSSSNAMETDNHMIVAVPEPSTYAAMGLGLGLLGFAARRRAAKR